MHYLFACLFSVCLIDRLFVSSLCFFDCLVDYLFICLFVRLLVC